VASLVFGACQSKKEKTEDNAESKAKETTAEMVDPENPPVMSFEETVFDFGTVSEGEVVKHTFYFSNTGKSPLIIHSAQGSCGCTVPDWPKEPIAPGEEGKIEVTFNSNGKGGDNKKLVTILANTKPVKTVITIKGFVKEAKK